MTKHDGQDDPRSRYRAALDRGGLADADVAGLLTHDLERDLEPAGRDVTSWAFVEKKREGRAQMRTREAGVLAGLDLLWPAVESFRHVDFDPRARDGDALEPGQTVAVFAGRLRELLTLERTALNFVTHLSGVASLTARFVERVRGTRAVICDTRKTLPGLKLFQKYAVVCGGGTPHRQSLGDAVLVKDNHLAGVPQADLPRALTKAAEEARTKYPALKFVEVEVDTLDQLRVVLRAPIDIALLDNMTNDQLAEAIAIRNAESPGVRLEASGGVNLETVRGIAETGVDRISVGALTHSAPALDLGLDIGDAD